MANSNRAAADMKRLQRRRHFAIWIILSAVIAIVLGKAIADRPAEPVNPDFPSAISDAKIEDSSSVTRL